MKSGCMLLFGVVVAMVLQSAAATVRVDWSIPKIPVVPTVFDVRWGIPKIPKVPKVNNVGWSIPKANTKFDDNLDYDKVLDVADVLSFANDRVQDALQPQDEPNVVEVSKAAYYACTKTNPLYTFGTVQPARLTNGTVQPARLTNITLTTVGEHYYICTIGRHCENGMKLKIIVQAPTTTPPGSSSSMVLGSVFVTLSSIAMGLFFLIYTEEDHVVYEGGKSYGKGRSSGLSGWT